MKRLYDVLVKEEANIETQKKFLEGQLEIRFSEALSELQKTLVQKTRVDDAVAVRNFREGGAMTALITGVSPTTQVKPVVVPKDSTAGSAPAAHQPIIYPPRPPTSPPALPEVRCHLVLVRQETVEGKRHMTPEFLHKCHKDGERDDLVSFANSRNEWAKLGAISANGEVVSWQNKSDLVHPGPVASIESLVSGPFVTLDPNGKLKIHGKWDEATGAGFSESEIAEFENLSHITSINATKNFLGALDRDGKPYGIGDFAKRQHFRNLLKERSKICQFRTTKDMTVALLENGNVIYYNQENRPEKTATNQSRLMQYGTLDQEGFFHPHPWHREEWEKAGDLVPSLKSPRNVEIFAGRAFALTDDYQAIFWNKDSETEQWKRNPELEKALAGAQQLRSLKVLSTRWLVALLPKGTVPRGGFWKAQELAAARTAVPD